MSTMIRASFTRNCAQTREGTPPPYYALPSPSSETAKQFYSQDKDKPPQVIPHMVPRKLYTGSGKDATHIIYTWNGSTKARAVGEDAIYALSIEEFKNVNSRFPDLLVKLPDVETIDETVSHLIEEKRQVEELLEEATEHNSKAHGKISSLEAEIAALKAELAGRKKADEAKKKAADAEAKTKNG